MKTSKALALFFGVKCLFFILCGSIIFIGHIAGQRIPGIDIYDENGYTPLMNEVALGNIPVIRQLIAQGANVNARARDYDGNTPLSIAIINADFPYQMETIALLMAYDADPTIANNMGLLPVHHVLNIYDLEKRLGVLKLLLYQDADINAQDRDGNTLLHLSVITSNLDWIIMIKTLMGRFIDFSIKNNDNLTPLELAYKLGLTGDESIVTALLEPIKPLGLININERDYMGRTNLMLAIMRSDLPQVIYDLQHGADVQLADNEGNTALHLVYLDDDPVRVAQLLLERKAPVNAINKEGKTPLQMAMKILNPLKREQTVKILMQRGAKLATSLNSLAQESLKREEDIVRFITEYKINQLRKLNR